MSLLGSIGSALKGGVKGFITGGPGGAVMGALGGIAKGSTSAPPRSAAMGSPLRVLPTTNSLSASNMVKAAAPLARAGKVLVQNAGTVATVVGAGALLYDAFGNVIGHRKRRRRMNPMNARAARRAIRRIKGARKMLQQIERQLPKQRTASRSSPSSRRNVQEFIRQG